MLGVCAWGEKKGSPRRKPNTVHDRAREVFGYCKHHLSSRKERTGKDTRTRLPLLPTKRAITLG